MPQKYVRNTNTYKIRIRNKFGKEGLFGKVAKIIKQKVDPP